MKEAQIKKNIADNLRVLRAKKRMSQERLAEKADMSKTFITDLENEKSNPTSYILVKLAEALEVTVNDLIYEKK